MKLEDAAETLAQLGNPTRLEVVRYLVKTGPSGVGGQHPEAVEDSCIDADPSSQTS